MELRSFCFPFVFHERLHHKELNRQEGLFTRKIGEAFDVAFIYI